MVSKNNRKRVAKPRKSTKSNPLNETVNAKTLTSRTGRPNKRPKIVASHESTELREAQEVEANLPKPLAEGKFLKLAPAIQSAMKIAVKNIISLGDTDVFPRSFENRAIADRVPEFLELLAQIHRDFNTEIAKTPPVNCRALMAVGYSGFRTVTQIDPLWNAYLLSLVILIGVDIESARIAKDKEVVHSYRFSPEKNGARVFDNDFGWFSFAEKSDKLAELNKFVLITDISDFYPRIYHHRLENALKKATKNTDVIKRIMLILGIYSGSVSYGLPVGGPAARLLSEIVLNSIDRLLIANKVTFCRFVDDFRVFSNTREEAHATLVTLAQALEESDGLSLQKSKSRIMSSDEYLSLSTMRSDRQKSSSDESGRYKAFMSLRLHFDPYSDSAVEDYEELRRQLASFDVVGMLLKEIRKSQIEESILKKIVRSMRHISASKQAACVSTLAENLALLSPVFPHVVQVFLAIENGLPSKVRNNFINAVCDLFNDNSYIVQVPLNQAFALRILNLRADETSEQILKKIYDVSTCIGVKRDVIIAMMNADATWFVSDRRRNYQYISTWERRAVIVSSYVLEDEGDHWRQRVRQTWTAFENFLAIWASGKKQEMARLELVL